VQKASREIKKRFPEMLVITDVCLCEYTSHGHCGVIENEFVQNDATLECWRTSLDARAVWRGYYRAVGYDGRAHRSNSQTLNENGFAETPIMAYAAKYSPPFTVRFAKRRKARRNSATANLIRWISAILTKRLREIALDIQEGADIVMVKPALCVLDIIRRAKDNFNSRFGAYHVFGRCIR
jgi:porphobilinogen synthase